MVNIANDDHRPNVVTQSRDDWGPIPTGAERWRMLAAETFAAAQAMADPESKQVLLLIAGAYERLAERAQAPKKANLQRLAGHAERMPGEPALRAMGSYALPPAPVLVSMGIGLSSVYAALASLEQ
jgi:hypothetical protein